MLPQALRIPLVLNSYPLPGEHSSGSRADFHLARRARSTDALPFRATCCHGSKIEIPWYMESNEKHRKNGLVAGFQPARRPESRLQARLPARSAHIATGWLI
jgi:hypothetical protein